MLIKKLLILFFLFFSINGYAKDKWHIKNINFYGLHRISRENIVNYINKYSGNIISTNNLNKIVFNLLQTGQFKDIKVIKFKDRLTFILKEQSSIYNIRFSTPISISNSVIKELLSKKNLKIGNRLNPSYVDLFKNILKRYYISIGKYNIDIKPIFLIKKNSIAYIEILISENKCAVIDTINIFGNHFFSSKKILSLFKFKYQSNFRLFIEKRIYSIKQFRNHLRDLRNFYVGEGYIHFNFIKVYISSSSDKRRVHINIILKEGKKYCISNIFFHCRSVSYFKRINTIVNGIIRKKFDFNQIIKLKKIIRNIFFCDGYPNINIFIYFKINHIDNSLYFYIDIYPNQRYLLNKIYFIGNKFTTDKFLRSKVKHKEGTWLNSCLLIQGKKNLIDTGYFKDIKLNFYNFNNILNNIDVIYTLLENNSGSVNFSFGYGMDSGINFNFNMIQNHLLRLGSQIRISGIKDSSQTSGELIFKYPLYGIFNNYFKGRLFFNYFKSNLINSINIKNKQYGLNTVLGFLINKKNEFDIGINSVHNNVFHMQSQFSIWHYLRSLKSIYKKYNTNDIFMTFSWIFNNLYYSNIYLSGNNTIFNGKMTILGSESHFKKMKFDSREYYQFKNDKGLILFTRAYFGLGYSNIINEEFPFYENYYSGGVGSVRGFKYNSIGPKDVYSNQSSDSCIGKQYYKLCQSSFSTGGNAIIITNLELIKILFLNNINHSNLFTTSIFLDSAAVWNTYWIRSLDSKISNFIDYSNPYDIRISAGISLQWISPLGPLNFSYAYPLKFNIGDTIEPFQFSIGKSW